MDNILVYAAVLYYLKLIFFSNIELTLTLTGFIIYKGWWIKVRKRLKVRPRSDLMTVFIYQNISDKYFCYIKIGADDEELVIMLLLCVVHVSVYIMFVLQGVRVFM